VADSVDVGVTETGEPVSNIPAPEDKLAVFEATLTRYENFQSGHSDEIKHGKKIKTQGTRIGVNVAVGTSGPGLKKKRKKNAKRTDAAGDTASGQGQQPVGEDTKG
jgi:hypothetical protein